MLEDFRRGNEDEVRRQREAAEKAARNRAQASLAQLSMSQGPQSSWGTQPQNYPPAPSWQVELLFLCQSAAKEPSNAEQIVLLGPCLSVLASPKQDWKKFMRTAHWIQG